jgi:hypothetical protein
LERKGLFVEDNMLSNVNPIGKGIETLITMMRQAITEKNTGLGTEGKFVGVVGTKIWPTLTTKNFEELIVGRFMEEQFIGRGVAVDT